jgi:transcriptional regulator of acetoin/glycerol metabolism
LEHLPAGLAPRRGLSEAGTATQATDDSVLRARIETALSLREGNVAQVARDLGLGRPWLYQMLRRLAIDPDAFRRR